MLLACIATATVVAPSGAATNAVTAGIGGLDNGTISGGDGTGTGRFVLNTVGLALVMQARALDGTVVPDGSDVFVGDEIYFLLYVDNPTAFDASDVRLRDPLDETQFVYVAGTLEAAAVPSGSNDAAIWAGAWTPLSDAVGAPDDGASATDTGGPPGADRITVGAEPTQANQALDVPAGSLRAIRFRVSVN